MGRALQTTRAMGRNIELQTETGNNMTTATLLEGNCLDRLRTMADESVHAIITDPPYGLANTDPAHVVEALTKWATGDREFIPEGRGFMGKAWDAFVPPPAVWDECLRVLKPGGQLLAFAGSRTFDLMALSIRFAGFDIRDSIAWLYGSGFPKSMDVSKAIDKIGGGRDVVLLKSELRRVFAASGITLAELNDRCGFEASGYLRTSSTWASVMPTPEKWRTMRDVIGCDDDLSDAFREAERKITGPKAWTNSAGHFVPGANHTDRVQLHNSESATEQGRVWEGWGTALKPAFEPIVVARKPFPGTVAANVLAHGTGALNIAATRIEGERWPANVMLDDSQAAVFEESRFFYVAKAPKSERPVVSGEAHPTVKPIALMRQLVKLVTPPGGIVVDPFAGSGTTLEAAHREGFDSIGIEMTDTYWPLVRHRIDRAEQAASAKTSADDEALFSWEETA
jgi:DNA modification methylase